MSFDHDQGDRTESAAGGSRRGRRRGRRIRLIGALLLALVGVVRAPAAEEPASEPAAATPPFGALPTFPPATGRPAAEPFDPEWSPAAAAQGDSEPMAACRALFFVVTHRAGYAPPEDEEAVRALLRGLYLGLAPEWPDGLRAYPLARPADHPVSRMIKTRVIAAAPAEIAHHWQVMAQRFGQTPPPVVGSPRLILQLVARRPGAVAILAGDELPDLSYWPDEVVIAATLGAPAARARCPLARLRVAFGRADAQHRAADASGIETLADSRGPDGRSRGGGPALPQVPGYRVP